MGILDLTLLTTDLASKVVTGILHLSLMFLPHPHFREVSVVLPVSQLKCSRAWALVSVQPRVRCGISTLCLLDHPGFLYLKRSSAPSALKSLPQ